MELKLWEKNDWGFDENYNYQAEFDWCDKALAFGYVKEMVSLTELDLSDNRIQDISVLADLKNLKLTDLRDNPINLADIETLRQQLPNCHILFEY